MLARRWSLRRPLGLFAEGRSDDGAPVWVWIAALAAWIGGCAWRWYWVFVAHPPTSFIYSDMQGYHHNALYLLDPNTVWGIQHTLVPPGNSFWLAFWRSLGGSTDSAGLWATKSSPEVWAPAFAANAVLSCLTPLLLTLAVRLLFGSRAACLTLAIASVFFQFVDNLGYFLAETPFTFLLALTLLAVVAACRTRGLLSGINWAMLAGIAGAAALVTKGQVLFGLGLVGAFLLVAGWRRRRLWLLLAAMVVAGMAFLAPVAVRATRLNEGRFCLISTNAGNNFLQGHYGWQYGCFYWDDAKRGMYFTFGSPCVVQKGITAPVHFPFGVYEVGPNVAEALKWMKANPVDAVLQTLEHPFELYVGTIVWPTSHTSERKWMVLSEHLYLLLLLLPASALVLIRRRRLWAEGGGELLLLLPIIGNAISAAVFTGEPRYRVPFDLFTIALAARFWVDWRRFREIVPTTASPAVSPDPVCAAPPAATIPTADASPVPADVPPPTPGTAGG